MAYGLRLINLVLCTHTDTYSSIYWKSTAKSKEQKKICTRKKENNQVKLTSFLSTSYTYLYNRRQFFLRSSSRAFDVDKMCAFLWNKLVSMQQMHCHFFALTFLQQNKRLIVAAIVDSTAGLLSCTRRESLVFRSLQIYSINKNRFAYDKRLSLYALIRFPLGIFSIMHFPVTFVSNSRRQTRRRTKKSNQKAEYVNRDGTVENQRC